MQMKEREREVFATTLKEYKIIILNTKLNKPGTEEQYKTYSF